jgi:hypothetical protein
MIVRGGGGVGKSYMYTRGGDGARILCFCSGMCLCQRAFGHALTVARDCADAAEPLCGEGCVVLGAAGGGGSHRASRMTSIDRSDRPL